MTEDRSRGGGERGAGRLIRVVVTLAPIAFAIFAIRSGTGAGGDASEASLARRPLLRPATTLTAEPGESLEAFLARGGLSSTEARRVGELTRPYLDLADGFGPPTGRFHAWPEDPPEKVDLRVSPDLTLVFEVEGAVWTVAAAAVPVSADTVVVTGRVDASLWGADLAGDDKRMSPVEKGRLPGHLADVFAWQVDFFRDVRTGDRFRLALERDVRPNGSIRGERVLAAEWHSGDTRLEAYRFSPSDEPGDYFYDAEGTALRGTFLKAPLELVRITSRFSSNRYHPVLGRYRAHQGVDYGAASGTEVRVTGDGTVLRAGWAGEYGLLVEVEHSSGVRTRYAHLSGIASGVRPGARLGQAARIGLVGSTGLATGPHLHYEFLVNGRAVDPASVDLPIERPLPETDGPLFARVRYAAGALLRRVGWPRLADQE